MPRAPHTHGRVPRANQMTRLRRRATRRRPPPPPKPKRYWTDLRFRHSASDDGSADTAIARLVAAAEDLGFDLELTKTRPHAPAEPLPD
jgi:hypothetical protein